jgi:glyoxylase-like metal-dependent hydrolase (beta-lactamase superfamily II)
MRHPTAEDRTGWLGPGTSEAAPGVYRIPLPLPQDGLRAVNVYAIRDGAGLVLVDTGWRHPETVAALREGLRELGSNGSDITRVLATHSHYDHYGLTAFIREHSGAEIRLGREEVESLRPALEDGNWGRADEHRRQWLVAHGAQKLLEQIEREGSSEDYEAVRAKERWEAPDRLVDHGDVIELHDRRLEAVLTPGHTRGHLAYLDRDNRLLFAGDHVLPHITPSLGFEPFTDGRALERFLVSLRQVHDLDVELVLPGHGPVFEDLAGRVDELLAHHDARLEASASAVAKPGQHYAADVATHLLWTRHDWRFDDLDGLNRLLAVGETVTHLEFLAEAGRLIRIEHADGSITYANSHTPAGGDPARRVQERPSL